MDARQQELMERFPWYGPHLAYLGHAVDYEPKKANLRGVNLQGADLERADLQRANLQKADLRLANLQRADLERSNLQEANLQEANLHRTNLRWVNLRGANLRWADLEGADLQEANLEGAILEGAYLEGAKSGSICRMDFGGWTICIREDVTSIGCKMFKNEFWLNASDDEISKLDKNALNWWEIHGSVIRDTIKLVMGKGKTK